MEEVRALPDDENKRALLYFDAVVKALGPNMRRMISEEKAHKAAAARCRDPNFWEKCFAEIDEVMHAAKRAKKQ